MPWRGRMPPAPKGPGRPFRAIRHALAPSRGRPPRVPGGRPRGRPRARVYAGPAPRPLTPRPRRTRTAGAPAAAARARGTASAPPMPGECREAALTYRTFATVFIGTSPFMNDNLAGGHHARGSPFLHGIRARRGRGDNGLWSSRYEEPWLSPFAPPSMPSKKVRTNVRRAWPFSAISCDLCDLRGEIPRCSVIRPPAVNAD